MTIANAFKEFFFILNGVKPSGNNIADVVRNGTSNVQRNNESALATRVATLEADKTTIVLNSSTEDSTKKFNITVDDSGAVTATEIVAE